MFEKIKQILVFLKKAKDLSDLEDKFVKLDLREKQHKTDLEASIVLLSDLVDSQLTRLNDRYLKRIQREPKEPEKPKRKMFGNQQQDLNTQYPK
jgi:ribosome-associated translation inhibitor RaiA